MTTTTAPTVETTVGQLVAQHPGWTRTFENLGIDYCCGGELSLAEICAGKGLDAETVLNVLLMTEKSTASEERDWSKASLTDLADHIEQTHHAFLKQELPRLATMIHKVASVHGGRHAWLHEIESVYTQFEANVQVHLSKEEQRLFPLVRRMEKSESGADGGNAANGIDTDRIMEHEHAHDHVAQALAQMRELSDGFTTPDDGCNTLRATLGGLRDMEADLHRHIHKENNVLFPRILEMRQTQQARAR